MFNPFKAYGPDGIFPVFLQRQLELLLDTITRIYVACLVGAPVAWWSVPRYYS